MTKITILGAGIAGLSAAAQLPKHHHITIVARDLPGDDHESHAWSSPHAGAIWMPLLDAPPREQDMQLQAFAHMWKIAGEFPESSVKSWVLTPTVFLPWLRGQLEAAGVAFKRVEVRSLEDLKGMGHDVLINATGWGARYLGDVADRDVEQVRGQTVLVKTDFDKVWTRRGRDYIYVISRGDGTAILGGIKQYGNTDTSVDSALREDVCHQRRVSEKFLDWLTRRTQIFRRVHDGLPDVFPEQPSDFKVVRDIVGIRPQRKTGARVERDDVRGQKVVHAYGEFYRSRKSGNVTETQIAGAPGGGYVYSFGMAREVARLVDEIEQEIPKAKL
ncbi:hypothetical protein SLS57_009895 [Botryosphaeria dothidea]